MARGGSRPGAGRKQGATTKRTREIADRAVAEGISPLEYMLARMRDPEVSDDDRMEMAKAAAPYVHPKLSSIEANLNGDLKLSTPKVIEFVSPEADAGPD